MNDTINIPNGWKETTLGEVVVFQRGFDLPSKDRIIGNYPLIVSNGFDGYIDNYKVNAPGIVTGRSGTLGNVFFIDKNFWPLNTTLWIKEFYNNDIKFIYYFLKTFPFEKYNSGSGVPTLNRNHIHPIKITIPENLSEQQSIAQILTSFDDKIELLQAQNKTLETLAQTIFTEWFGKYTVDDELPEGWGVDKITNLFEVRDGTHDSPKQSQTGMHLITSRHILKNNLDFNNAYLISEKDFNEINKRSLVETNDILFSMIGTLGLTYLEQSENINYAIKNVALFKTSKNTDWMYYTYLWLISTLGNDFVKNYKTGSTQEYIPLGSLRNIDFINPDKDFLEKFNHTINPLFKKIKANTIQIQSLTQTRDALLPKLMSGEVRVNELKK